MANMFRDSNSFNNGGSPSISGWTTNDCTNMRSMFYNANSFDQPIGSWDVSNVTNMGSMFRDCIFNNGGSPSISGWTTSACTSISAMFRDNPSFNQPIGSWDVSNVTNMSNMLNNTSISVDNYNDILTGWTGWDGTGATKTLKTNVTLGATGLNFTSGSTAEDAKNYLITGLTWTITDAGGV